MRAQRFQVSTNACAREHGVSPVAIHHAVTSDCPAPRRGDRAGRGPGTGREARFAWYERSRTGRRPCFKATIDHHGRQDPTAAQEGRGATRQTDGPGNAERAVFSLVRHLRKCSPCDDDPALLPCLNLASCRSRRNGSFVLNRPNRPNAQGSGFQTRELAARTDRR